jgi:hypothetical protein
LILWSGAILPFGSHHSSDSRENFAISAGSTVEGVAVDDSGLGAAMLSEVS